MLVVVNAFAFDHKHAGWDTWLKKYTTVKGSVTTVNYAAAKNDMALMTVYLKDIQSLPKAEFETFGPTQKLAFLINAYNALTVKLILDNYPVKSIKDLGSFFSSPWKKKFFTLFGEEHHLDDIEHEMIRKNFNEARIHFAVVCASKGCPALRGEAFVADKLVVQLEEQAKSFLSDNDRNRYSTTENKFYISMIFKWYKEDFVKDSGDVASFVAKRMGATVDEVTRMKTAEVKHLDYDWTLNETPTT